MVKHYRPVGMKKEANAAKFVTMTQAASNQFTPFQETVHFERCNSEGAKEKVQRKGHVSEMKSIILLHHPLSKPRTQQHLTPKTTTQKLGTSTIFSNKCSNEKSFEISSMS